MVYDSMTVKVNKNMFIFETIIRGSVTMSSKTRILAIAPYEELNHSMRTVSQQFEKIRVDIYTADLEEGQRLALDLYHNDYDAIVSRGGTADLIRQAVSGTIPVIDVSISIYDILGAIRLANNYTKSFAIVGYSSITEPAHLICDILEYNIKIITLDKDSDPGQILDTLSQENFELILCDAITNRLALSKSLTTILITSGSESVKRAYQEAITISHFLKKEKHKRSILENSFKAQKQDMMIFDDQFQIRFSTLMSSLENVLLGYLRTKGKLNSDNQYFPTLQGEHYTLTLKRLQLDNTTYFSCLIKKNVTPMVNNHFGIFYQKREEVEEIFNTKLLFTKFIQEETKLELKKINRFYNALIIFGDEGTAKTNIAYQAFLNQKDHNSNLITVDTKFINDKTWKFLLNPSNGPLVEDNNTILFKNVEQLSLENIEKLIIIIKNTKLLRRNNLLFTYNTNKFEHEPLYNRLHSSLDCGSIHALTLKERKNELNAISTLLLNKINIESNLEIIGFEPKALQIFLDYDWPGNFNQLQSALKELVVNASSHYISEHQVTQLLEKETLIYNFSHEHLKSFALPSTIEQPTLFDYNKYIILNVLEQNNGNQTKTARQLGISRTTLWRYIKEN